MGVNKMFIHDKINNVYSYDRFRLQSKIMNDNLLKAGKIDNKTFEKNTKVLDIANNEANATKKHNGVFDKFNEQNSNSIDYINQNLKKIVNLTGREFDWDNIISGTSSDPFVTGTIGNVEIVAEYEKKLIIMVEVLKGQRKSSGGTLGSLLSKLQDLSE